MPKKTIKKQELDELVELTIQFYENDDGTDFDNDKLLDKIHNKRKKVFGVEYHCLGHLITNIMLLKRDYHKPKTIYYRVLELLGYEVK